MQETATSIDIAREVLETEAAAVLQVIEHLDSRFEDAVRLMKEMEGRVVVSGMGKSGLIGEKFSATLASTGTPSLSLHPAEAVHGDLGRVVRGDLLVVLSNGGETEELVRLVGPVKRIGVSIIAMVGNTASTLASHADVVLSIGHVDEACSLGLAPTASTTAMLALCDALAMAVCSERKFTREEYAMFHPAGQLGRKLMKVGEIMRTGEANPVVNPDTPLAQVLLEITRVRAGWAVVVDEDGTMAGIFTDGDLRRHIERGGDITGNPVKVYMNPDPTSTSPDTLAIDALRVLRDREIDGLPVVDGSRRPVGWLDVQDLLQAGLV